MINPKFLLSLRKEQQLSQDFIAKKIGLSRPTYIEIEKGNKDLSLSQAQLLAKLFNITLEELIAGKCQPKLKISLKEGTAPLKKIPELRIDVPQKNIRKFKEVLLYILEKVGSKPNLGMTVLYKLLYFIDFDYYEKFEEQLMGAVYIKNHFGPTPIAFKQIIEQMEAKEELTTVKNKYFQHEQTKYLPRREPDLTVLNAREMKHIDEVLERLSNKSAKDLSDYSHQDVPWITAQEGKPLSYEAVFYRTEKTSVRDYDSDAV